MTLLERLQQAATRDRPQGIANGDWDEQSLAEPVAAAVLVGVTDRPEPGLLLTVRRPDMRRHPGQIAFPGGRAEPDETPIQTALREAEEEIGLPQAASRVAGTLDPYTTITGYQVTPVLALVPPDLPLSPHEAEVSDLFEAPLPYLLDRTNHVRQHMLVDGRERAYTEIVWEGRRIWGATAAMIVNLSRRLQWP
ncbi:CoA pyrophosphatase [Sphingomonas piscis]|uniref:CoA pyrophosphatase n=1 Tax=Sphingomonas piscis TaxID=2714943 RepID=A0A6G7YRX6_9SPHN|nr:CoA pyrophosphatase [Sphingomonas piscis]QIK79493.1 CoA pyrophosphatase [Sphingomonas piscis]